jgi:hypothetical protein
MYVSWQSVQEKSFVIKQSRRTCALVNNVASTLLIKDISRQQHRLFCQTAFEEQVKYTAKMFSHSDFTVPPRSAIYKNGSLGRLSAEIKNRDATCSTNISTVFILVMYKTLLAETMLFYSSENGSRKRTETTKS